MRTRDNPTKKQRRSLQHLRGLSAALTAAGASDPHEQGARARVVAAPVPCRFAKRKQQGAADSPMKVEVVGPQVEGRLVTLVHNQQCEQP
mmetsp:Transcript_18395/g.39177  ORF Transcript_18395/g.39177 Transcript_18395/m.39177 type:complete len:90 (+) Transcript_18395:230-499(+)